MSPADLTNPFGESCCDGGATNCSQSAQSCGCDMGCKPEPHYCERHKTEREWKSLMKTMGEFLEEFDIVKEIGDLLNGQTEEAPRRSGE